MNILIAGDSISANCGFTLENEEKYQFRNVLRRNGVEVTDVSVDGCSNLEIMYRAIEGTTGSTHDLTVVQWSSLHRVWMYSDYNNLESPTIIYPVDTDANSIDPLDKAALAISKNYEMHFLNVYMAFKHWLLQIISLQSYFKANDIRYVFVNGFVNYLPEVIKLTETGFPLLHTPSEGIKMMFDIENQPDEVLNNALQKLDKLIKQIDQDNFIGFPDYAIQTSKLDAADDGKHPGPKTNEYIANILLEYING